MSDWTNNDSDGESTDLGVNLEDIETVPELLPPGIYPVCVTRTRIKQSKNNPSTKLCEIEETITDGPARGRKLWSSYVVAHERGEVMAMGLRDVATAARAYGVTGSDVSRFVEREAMASVVIEAGKNGYSDRNKVMKRASMSSASAAPKTSTPASKPAPKPAASKGPAPSFLTQRRMAASGADRNDGES